MSTDKRESPRLKLPVSVELTVEGQAPLLLQTRDISDGGLFLETGAEEAVPSVGTRVRIKVNANLNGEPPPELWARVVRQSPEGIAVAFEVQPD